MKIKRILSLVLVLSLVISCLGVMSVSAETNATLVYDMDLSQYASSGTINNAVSGSGLSFAMTSSTAGKVAAAEFVNETTKAKIPYISTTNSGSKLQLTTTDADMLGESYTFEGWIQKKHLDSINDEKFMSIFSNASTSNMSESNANVTLRTTGKTGNTNSSGDTTATIFWKGAQAYISKKYNDNEWIKFTLVREVVDEEGAYAVKKRLYINGSDTHDRGSKYVEQVYTLTAPYSETQLDFVLGYNMQEFNIAEVKLYKGVLTAEEIAQAYADEKTTYDKAPETDLLVYEMDLSKYAKDGIIKNGVSGVNSVVEANPATATPVIKANGAQKSLTFYAKDGSEGDNRKKAITVPVSDVDFSNKDEITLEFWIKNIGLEEGRLFSLANGNTNADLKFDGYVYGANTMYYRVDGSSTNLFTQSLTSYNNKWTHVVFTRNWLPTPGNRTNGKWYGEMYINGVRVKRTTGSAATRASESGVYLTIGNKSSNSTSFNGEIAVAKVYTSILDDADVLKNYNAGLASDKNVVFKNTNGDIVETLDELSTIRVEYCDVISPTTLYVAFYEDDKNLITVKPKEINYDADYIDIEIPENTKKVKAFVWEKDILSPINEAESIALSAWQ